MNDNAKEAAGNGSGESPCYPEHPYDAIVREWKKTGKSLSMHKHTAANAKTCQRIIEQLESAGMHEEASWALWQLWWRWQDSVTHEAIQQQYRDELSEARSA